MSAAVLSATLGLAGLGLAATPVAADTVDTVTDDCGRLAGQTRFGTAGAIADAYDAESPTDHAIVANGFNFPDALAASALGRELNAPVLLVNQDSVPLETASALQDLGIVDVTIVGGTAAVGQGVEDTLAEDYTVDREAGTDRYETARDIALAIAEVGQLDGLNTAIIATGNNYPDALAGGPVAYHGDGTNPFPILLTNGSEIPAATQEALDAHSIEQVIVLGGTDAVPASVVAELATSTGNAPIVLAGTTREGTAQEVADFAVAELGFAPEAVLLADGREIFPSPDALSGGPLGGVEMAPILLVNPGMPAETEAFITENADAITQVIALGGTVAVPTEVLNAGCEAGGVPIPGTTNQTFTVTGAEAATNVVSTATTNTGAREYSVTGLTAGTTYDVRLFPSANVTTDANGIVSFADADDNSIADPGTVAARIEQVNGLGVVPAVAVEAAPAADGTLTFLIDATQPDSVIPVIFLDAEAAGSDDDSLDLDADNLPTEDFGIGGLKVWTPMEAADGAIGTDSAVQSVDKDNNVFVLGTGAAARFYVYEAEDTFQIATTPTSGNEASVCTQVSQAVFEAELSAADEIDQSSVYFNEGDAETVNDGPSTFCLENLNPDLTENVAANRTNDTTVLVTISDDDVQQDSFNIYRATDTTPGDACPDFQTAGATGRGLYALAGSVAEDGNMTTPEESFTDTGLTASTKYCYAVTAVNDGDEGVGTDEQATTTLAAGDTAEPVSQDATVTNDEGSGAFLDEGTASAGDVFRVIFDEALDAPGAGDTIRVQDADGEFADITCTTDATCTVNASAVTIGTQTYAAGRVLTITLNGAAGGATVAVDGDADTAAANDGVLEYPLTITRATGFTDADTDNAQWTPLDDPDNVLNVNESAPATTAVAPTFASAADIADAGATDMVAVNYSEAVTASGGTYTAGNFVYEAACDGTVTATATGAAQGDGDTINLTFADAALPAVDDVDDCIRYIGAAGVVAGDVVDLDGNEQPTGNNVAVGANAS